MAQDVRDISSDLSTIRTAAAALHGVLDQATAQVRHLDAHLAGLNLGVRCVLDTPFYDDGAEDEAGPLDVDYHLAYGPAGDGTPGLCVMARAVATDEDG
ncbi:MAG: hypothetical protein JWO31_3566, partial [Phycisphaerales bacterium]|nr:hypothetical protein [Phycisphaerales bacterium]